MAVPLHNLDLLRESYKEDLFIYYKWLFVYWCIRWFCTVFRLHRVFPPVNSYRATHCRNMRLGVLKSEEKVTRWRMGEGEWPMF